MKFHEITGEAAFIIRALFFLVFGYLIETHELLNTETLKWAFGIAGIFFLFRFLQLKFSGLPLRPLWFIAPRGLITILLYLSIENDHLIPLVNKSLVIQIIIITALIMMIGMLVARHPVAAGTTAETEETTLHVDSEEAQPIQKLR